jgi:hypothetical protein
MSHFNVKTLSFYGIAIGSVLILFKTVSAYGETKLKAPLHIDGSYQFTQAENLPACLQGQQLKLNVDQSGIYLFGSLALQPKSGEQNPVAIPFSGNFKDNLLVMSGGGEIPGCDSPMQLTIQGQPEDHSLVGQVKDDLAGTEGNFVAQDQKPASKSSAPPPGH